jgi:DNA-binding phage protein
LRDLNLFDKDEAEGHYGNGRDALRKAQELLEGQSPGEFHLSTLAELGRLYRDWTRLSWQFGELKNAAERKDLAQFYLDGALKMAHDLERPDEVANIHEDMAQQFWLLKDEAATRSHLQKAEEYVPEEYKPRPGLGFTAVVEPINAFWLVMGKIYLMQAQVIFDHEAIVGALTQEQEEAMLASLTQRLLAVACFLQYSDFADNPGMKQVRAHIYRSLKSYGVPRLERVLAKTHEVATQYQIDLSLIVRYMERTLGIYTTSWE